MSTGTPAGYFDRMWATGDDPWAHGTRWYETRKYDLTVAALLRPRYQTVFEPGCGAGFLTQRLARRCDRLIAMERAERGVTATKKRCAAWSNVDVSVGCLPADWPETPLDLAVLSEVLYYLDDADLDDVLARCRSLRDGGGEIVAVHYRREVPEHARLGDEVHERLRNALGPPVASHIESDFVLENYADPAND